ncbi:hypothetical protein DBR32_07965 [Taibaiella sp. KBW10]|uniref:DUF3817 domain-containing protein n=1 Tax=Taibaiella sp. KBW10 TaxID=2153357 RepID=UPI000F591F7A|nr:DUF3817 domain-containing protein [Taibaiella sp. KBW10]RQO30658.1 hypothetical protein DBR32_07965 [Taibaiella sp. KBW10]
MKDKKALVRFGWVAILEGISFILLLLAMLMKYDIIGDVEMGKALVKNIGMAHGVLFVLYTLLLIQCWTQYSWKIGKSALYFILSFLPLGTFWVDKQVKKEINRLAVN